MKTLTDCFGNEIVEGVKVYVYHKNSKKLIFSQYYYIESYLTLLYHVENKDRFIVTIDNESNIAQRANSFDIEQRGI